MGINAEQLRTKLIRPILQKEHLWTLASEQLLMTTAAQESNLGEYIVQMDGGPAVGIFQMEPDTYHDIRVNVVTHPNIRLSFSISPEPQDQIWDFRLAAIMCRLAYWRHEEPLPIHTNIEGLAKYWKKYYNTSLGKGTIKEFMESYSNYIK